MRGIASIPRKSAFHYRSWRWTFDEVKLSSSLIMFAMWKKTKIRKLPYKQLLLPKIIFETMERNKWKKCIGVMLPMANDYTCIRYKYAWTHRRARKLYRTLKCNYTTQLNRRGCLPMFGSKNSHPRLPQSSVHCALLQPLPHKTMDLQTSIHYKSITCISPTVRRKLVSDSRQKEIIRATPIWFLLRASMNSLIAFSGYLFIMPNSRFYLNLVRT